MKLKKELKKILLDVPDNFEVLLESSDGYDYLIEKVLKVSLSKRKVVFEIEDY